MQDELAQTGRQVLLLKQVHHWPVIKGVLQVTRWTQKMHKPWELHVWPLITEVKQAARADSGGGSVLCSCIGRPSEEACKQGEQAALPGTSLGKRGMQCTCMPCFLVLEQHPQTAGSTSEAHP